MSKGTPPAKKSFLSTIARITSPPHPPPPQFGQLVPLFLNAENDVLARITEPSNNDYDDDVNDNCDNKGGEGEDGLEQEAEPSTFLFHAVFHYFSPIPP